MRLIISVHKYFFREKEKICKNIKPNTNPMALIYVGINKKTIGKEKNGSEWRKEHAKRRDETGNRVDEAGRRKGV